MSRDAVLSTPRIIAIGVSLGLVAHWIYRKHETYSIALQASLLCGPPALLVIYAISVDSVDVLDAVRIVFATYLGTLVSSIAVYRLSPFHPLARYPGPIGCRLSKFYMVLVTIRGYQHRHIKTLHERYGDVVRIGPNELSIRDASLVDSLYGASGVPKGPHFIGRSLRHTDLAMIGIQDMDIHLKRRRNWLRSMGPSAIKGYQPLLAQRARQLLSRLEEQEGELIMGDWFNYFSYDFVSDMTFGGGTELLSAGHDAGNVWAIIEEAMFVSTLFGHVPWLGVYVGKIPAVTGKLNELFQYCTQRAASRIEQGASTKDLFHYLNQEDQPDLAPPPTQQVVHDGILAIIAGADTTSSALTSILYCLLTHPEAYAKLQKEVDQFYPAGEDPFYTVHHREMPYLTAVINESLRIYPPAPGGSQRQVPHDGPGVAVGNLYLPPGTSFWLHVYSHHHDPRYFSNPSSFWPERWLLAARQDDHPSAEHDAHRDVATNACTSASGDAKGEGADSEFVHNDAAFLAFSSGPINCVGKTLAMLELRVVVCALLQRFRVTLAEGWDVREYERGYKDYFTASRPDLPVRLQVR